MVDATGQLQLFGTPPPPAPTNPAAAAIPSPATAWGRGQLPYAGSPPAVKGSSTSRQAAGRISGNCNAMRAKVLAEIIKRGAEGSTDEEAQTSLNMRVQSETPRRVELVAMGLVAASDQRRRTKSGRWARVWVATTAAMAAATAASDKPQADPPVAKTPDAPLNAQPPSGESATPVMDFSI